MRFKLTFFLILFNAILFGLIYYLEKEAAGIREYEKSTRTVFPAGVVDTSNSLEITTRQLTQNWVLEKWDDRWHIVQPIVWPANFYAVNRILNLLQFLEKETNFTVREIERAGRTLADYGLADPKATLSIGYKGGKSTIKIGQPTEIGHHLYILSPDQEEVYVVNHELLKSISIDLEELRSQQIFDIPLFEVRSLRISFTNPRNLTVRLVRENEKWVFETPIQTTADSARVEAAINSLTSTRIISFPLADLPHQGLNDSSLRLRVTIEGNSRRQTILVGLTVPGDLKIPQYFAKLADNPTVFTLSTAPFEVFFKAQEELREKKFVQFDRHHLSTIEIATATQSITLQKLETEEWQVLKKNVEGALVTWPADPRLMEEILTALADLEAVIFVSDAPAQSDLENYGFANPQRRITLQAATQTRLLLGDTDPKNNLLYAKIEAAPFVYQVQPDILLLLPPRSLHYRLRTLEEQPPAARIQTITLDDLEREEPLLSLERDTTLAEENGDPATAFAKTLEELSPNNREAARILLQSARKFEVKNYLHSHFHDGYQEKGKTVPWRYKLEVKINLPGGAQPHLRSLTFYFTERLGGTTQIGGSPDLGVVFTLNQKLIDALFAFTFTRKPPLLEEIIRTLPAGEDNSAPATAEPTNND